MRRRREGFSCVMVVILLLACLAIQDGVRMVKAATPPEVRVEPRYTKTVGFPNNFTIFIKVYYITSQKSLYAWEFRLEFNASILQVNKVDRGPFLETAGETWWSKGLLSPNIDNVEGFVTAGDALYGTPPPTQGAYGNGYLASITFQVKDNGASLLHLSSTELDTLTYGYLDPIKPHYRVDGYFEYPAKKHDIAVTAVTASPTSVRPGDSVSINATVKNEGEVTEAFNVTTYYENETIFEIIERQTFIDLAPSAETTLTFTWNTVGVDAGSYNISAWADLVDRNHPDISLGFIEASIDKADNYLYDGSVTIRHLIHPVASFTYSPTVKIFAGKTVTFNSNSSDPDGRIVSWAWDLNGDGVIEATTENTTYIYPDPGTYRVKLTVTDNDTLTSTATDDIVVLAPEIVRDVAITKITVSSNLVKIGELVYINVTVANEGNNPSPETFTVKVFYDDTTINVWQPYVWGVIGPGTEKLLNCTWDTKDVNPGTYTIKAIADTLTAPDEINTTNNELTYGTITLIPPVAPEASFTISPNPPHYIGDTLTLNASASHDPDGHIVTYEWNFGDETPNVTETEPTTTHVYTKAGTYTVTLTVTDNQSLTDIATNLVTVSEKHDIAIVNVTPSSNKVTAGELLPINVTVTNHGTIKETFNITIYYDNLIIGTKSVTNLAPDASETVTINWDTSNVDPDTYTIKAATSTITDDINSTNNELIDGTVTITAHAAPLDILVYAAAIGAAAIIMLAIAFYFLSARKQRVKDMAKTGREP